MKKNGYADTTIKAVGKKLRYLQKNCNLQDPEDVKGHIANKQCGNGHKESLIEAYAILMKSINKEWKQPFYKKYDKLPKIPTTEQLNMLIAELYAHLTSDKGGQPVVLPVNVSQIKDKLEVKLEMYGSRPPIFPHLEYLCDYIPPERISIYYEAPQLPTTCFDLLCIINSVTNPSLLEKLEIQFLRSQSRI